MAQNSSFSNCQQIENQIAALEARAERLQWILDNEPDLSEQTRINIAREINDIRIQIGELEGELERCRNAITILGVEKTQGIQYFNFNGQGSGRGSNNSVPMVEFRPLVLRVYVSFNSDIQSEPVLRHFDGVVRMDVQRSDGSYRRVGSFRSVNAPVRARAYDEIDRGNANHTVNFRIDPALCTGYVRFILEIAEWQPPVEDLRAQPGQSNCAAPANLQPVGRNFSVTTEIIYANFITVPTFRVRGVLINYTFGTNNIPAPSPAEFRDIFEYTATTFPFANAAFRPFMNIEFDRDLDEEGEEEGGCGPAWERILSILRRLAGDDESIYVGLLPGSIMDHANVGCGGRGAAVVLSGRPSTMAHEIAHALGRKHASGTPQADPHYPDYEGYPEGSIGEYGFNTQTYQVYSPGTYYDFMAYKSDRWISPYTYLALLKIIRRRFEDSIANGGEVRRGETLFLFFCVNREGKVNVRPGFHLQATLLPADNPSPPDIICELLDAGGKILVSHACYQQDRNGIAGTCCARFYEMMPWSGKATSIRFIKGNNILHTHTIEAKAPGLNVRPLTNFDGKQPVKINWSVQEDNADMEYMVRYSHDKGKTWIAVAARLKRTEWELRPATVAGGNDCMLQVIASAGIRTTVSEIKLGNIPIKPRQAMIVNSNTEQEGKANEEIRFTGAGFSENFDCCELEEASWVSNINGFLGYGFSIAARLSIGLHTVTFSVPDGMGNISSATVLVRIKNA